jgi:hypothetical protein
MKRIQNQVRHNQNRKRVAPPRRKEHRCRQSTCRRSWRNPARAVPRKR